MKTPLEWLVFGLELWNVELGNLDLTMSDTLAALHAAVIDTPADRTVRLVYADALDESGDPANAARAEFIRAQVALEPLTGTEPEWDALAERCDDLFREHWIDWWRPVCVAVGLPEPYVPTRRIRERVKRAVGREKREPGAPYTIVPKPRGVWSVRSEEHGFTAQFIAGFPELLYVQRFTAEAVARPFANWFAAAPVGRLRLAGDLAEWEWGFAESSALVRVSDLTFDRLSAGVAAAARLSSNLSGLTNLKVFAMNPAADVLRELVSRPTWAGLRSLTLTGASPPDAIQTLAERCTLQELESLSFGMCEVPEPPETGGLFGMIGAMFNEVQSRLLGARPLPPGPIRWPDYWPALDALARSPVLPRSRTLQVIDVDPFANTFDGFFRQVQRETAGHAPPDPENLFPDTLVRTLADGLNADKLVRLELPAARLSPNGRAELVRRFGPRLVLA